MLMKVFGCKSTRVLNSLFPCYSSQAVNEEETDFVYKAKPLQIRIYIVPNSNPAQLLTLRLLNTLVDVFQSPVVGAPHHTVPVPSGANWHPCW